MSGDLTWTVDRVIATSAPRVRAGPNGSVSSLLSSGIDVMDNQVDFGAVAFDPSMQVALDEEYGADLVHVEPALHPM